MILVGKEVNNENMNDSKPEPLSITSYYIVIQDGRRCIVILWKLCKFDTFSSIFFIIHHFQLV